MSDAPENGPDPAGTGDAEAIRAALLELVRLKDLKTQHGETADYRARRERAWEEARRVLGPAASHRSR